MLLKGINIGVGLTGSFCTIESVLKEIQNIVNEGANVFPIVSNIVKTTDTRFGKSADNILALEKITGRKVWSTIPEVEPIGPNNIIDIMLVAPCTGNTIAKLANGITDTPVTMSVKAHIRNHRPAVLSISTNDALGANGINIAKLINTKNIFFVPYYQDDYVKKPNSMVADTSMIIPTILEAINHKQIQPIISKSK